MKRNAETLFIALFSTCVLLYFSLPLRAQGTLVVVSAYSSKAFVVGGANQPAGTFMQTSGPDTTWTQLGSRNMRSFDALRLQTPSKAWFIAAGNGVHRTTDEGASWKTVTDWRMTEILSLAIHPASPRRIVAGTGHGIWASTDGGDTWNEMNDGIPFPRYTARVIPNLGRPGGFFAATEHGVYYCPPDARTWKQLSMPAKGVRFVTQDTHDTRRLIAGTEDDGLYRSTDDGRNWEHCVIGLEHATFYCAAFDPVHPARIFAAGFKTGVYRSNDGGESWEYARNEILGESIHAIAVDPASPSVLYAASMNSGVFRSEDGGLHWKRHGLDGRQIWSILMVREP